MTPRLELAREAALEAGRLVMSYYKDSYEVREKTANNPVTTADLEADRTLKRILLEGAPGSGWLSEETADSPGRLAVEEVWVVDPIDGTKEFILGIPEFAISVGLAVRGEIVAGVVYNPARDELFLAERRAGARLNGEPIRVAGLQSLAGARLDASRSECRRGEFEAYAGAFQMREVGSIAYKLARVAAGMTDVTWSLGPKNEWDIAAGVLLVEEAGGRATAPDGEAFRFNQAKTKVKGILATSLQLHAEAVRTVAADVARRRAAPPRQRA